MRQLGVAFGDQTQRRCKRKDKKEKRKTRVKISFARVGIFTNTRPSPPDHHHSAASFRFPPISSPPITAPLAALPPPRKKLRNADGGAAAPGLDLLIGWFVAVSVPLSGCVIPRHGPERAEYCRFPHSNLLRRRTRRRSLLLRQIHLPSKLFPSPPPLRSERAAFSNLF